MYVLGIVTEGVAIEITTPSVILKQVFVCHLPRRWRLNYPWGRLRNKNNCPCHKSLSEYCDKGSYLLNFEVTYSHFCVLREATHASRSRQSRFALLRKEGENFIYVNPER